MTDTFSASVAWHRRAADTLEQFGRDHEVHYGSGIVVPASSAPSFNGAADRVNPEEQLLGALSSCHMLTFLAVAAKKHLVVQSYTDTAHGVLDRNAAGRLAVTKITLSPVVVFDGEQPAADVLKSLHDSAHRNCFIANSIASEVTIL